ncbi:MAG: diacylglycerol kinase family lipid kinase [Parvibaculaceae bacterium]|nr:diacylglycerol kinase family lipid kinase [Parvibaculaceae bacterium]
MSYPVSTPHVAAVINPRSGGGHTGRSWRVISGELEKRLGPIVPLFTRQPATPHFLPGAELAREALRHNAQLVIAVGGDGTISEVANGFFGEDGRPVNPDAHFAIIPAGTGGDFRKSFGLSNDPQEAIARIASGKTVSLDVGHMRFVSHDGLETSRYFVNIASFGLSGVVVARVNRSGWPRLLGGRFTFFWESLIGSLGYRPQPVRLTIEGEEPGDVRVLVSALGNGRFFGGGMMIAPDARPDDGLFDFVTLRDMGFWGLSRLSGAIYKGTHTGHARVVSRRIRALTAEPLDEKPVLLDVDGEAPGRLPARFELLPGALTLRI